MPTPPAAVTARDPVSPFEVTLEQIGAVGLVRFSRPPHNHFSTELIASLADRLEEADGAPEIRATVLASDGPNFCAGADLVTGTEEPLRLYEQAARLFAIRKPMVAAVQGSAIGGGLGLAVAADFRIVSPSSRLSANFVKLGIHPGFAMTWTLPRLVGHQAAALLLYTGRRLGGAEAVAMGLADQMVPEDELRQAAIALAAEIAENAPLAVEATRATLRAGLVADIIRQTEREAGEQIRLSATEDFAEGVRAVSERRPGRWVRR
jgi:enoyl-CoA hydratase/carnithine racemase